MYGRLRRLLWGTARRPHAAFLVTAATRLAVQVHIRLDEGQSDGCRGLCVGRLWRRRWLWWSVADRFLHKALNVVLSVEVRG